MLKVPKSPELKACFRCNAPILSRYPRVRFCSPKCWYESQRARRKTRSCEVCKKPFFKKFNERTCSRACGGMLRRKRRSVSCKNCGNVIEIAQSQRSRKFCSFLCANIYSRKQLQVNCQGCGKEFQRGRALVRRNKNSYCSKECFKANHFGEATGAWRGGNSHYRGRDWRVQSAEARKRDAYTCQVCGKPQAKNEKLSVDHIIPWRIVRRNDLVNLISTCRAPCHASKTQGAEAAFLRGDYLDFREKLNKAGWPMEKVDAALLWWGTL
jgi:5-methylcytosine-specific restriction endonuclease McrA